MITVACVKAGSLYGPEYVNTLFDMVRRNLPVGFRGRFVCLTDDPAGLEEGIQTLPLPGDLQGWWNKLYLFAPGVFEPGERILYFDLDTVITGPLDQIVAYNGPFATLRDAYRPEGLQSSVMAWEAGNWTQHFWQSWNEGLVGLHYPARCMEPGGDQVLLERGERCMFRDAPLYYDRLQDLFPGKFRSYKVECRTLIPRGTSVVFFHGHPRPHEVTVGWVPEVWKIGGGSGLEWIALANVDDQTTRTQVASAIKRECEWVKAGEDTATAIIVGGGPSLTDNIFYIRGMQMAGAKVFATGNTFAFLKLHGIQPDAHVLLDARAENLDFVPSESVPKYYASQCHPSVLDAAGADLICWHAALTAYQPLIDREHPGMLSIGGGTTVGLKAIALAFVLGHRHLRLFGFDSSYGPSHHAYDQPLNDGEKTLDYRIGGRTFKCAPWMVTQAEDFKELVPLLLQNGCVLRIFGEGLIPHISSLMEASEPFIEIEGLWWPAEDQEARPAVLATLADLKTYIDGCPERKVAVQAGGNVGVWAKELAQHFEKVVTFEPDAINWECLTRNLKEPNVTAYQAALGDEPGFIGIQHVRTNCGASCVNGVGDIPVVTIDSLELPHCDLLQLDVEGYELKALKGAADTIRRCSPLIVLELKKLGERYGDSDEETIAYLATLGYLISGRAHRDVIFKRYEHYVTRTA